MTLKRVGPLSCAKISGTLYAILGLILGFFFSLIGMLGFAAQPEEASPIFGLVFGVGAIIVLPIMYGLLGFIMALIGAGLYNILASAVGGVEVVIE